MFLSVPPFDYASLAEVQAHELQLTRISSHKDNQEQRKSQKTAFKEAHKAVDGKAQELAQEPRRRYKIHISNFGILRMRTIIFLYVSNDIEFSKCLCLMMPSELKAYWILILYNVIYNDCLTDTIADWI